MSFWKSSGNENRTGFHPVCGRWQINRRRRSNFITEGNEENEAGIHWTRRCPARNGRPGRDRPCRWHFIQSRRAATRQCRTCAAKKTVRDEPGGGTVRFENGESVSRNFACFAGIKDEWAELACPRNTRKTRKQEWEKTFLFRRTQRPRICNPLGWLEIKATRSMDEKDNGFAAGAGVGEMRGNGQWTEGYGRVSTEGEESAK